MEDRDLLAARLDLVVDPDLIGRLDPEAQRARELVPGPEVGGEATVGRRQHPAALVRRVVPRMGDQLVEKGPRDTHEARLSNGVVALGAVLVDSYSDREILCALMAQSGERAEPGERGATATPFLTDPEAELPVGVQLAWRLRALIAAGRLAPGERMPSVRALAAWANVNVNTVRAVYARLEQDGVVLTRHGLGSFVAESAAGSEQVERIAGEAIDAAREAGVDPRDVALVAMVGASLPELSVEEPDAVDEPDANPESDLAELAAELELSDSWLDADDRVARGELRRQIGRLEAELADYQHELDPPPSTADRSPAGAAHDRCRRARADARRAARQARRGPRHGGTTFAGAAPRQSRPRRNGRRSRPASLGDRLGAGDGRGGVWELGGGAAPRTTGCVDELVARQGVGRMPVSPAAGGGNGRVGR